MLETTADRQRVIDEEHLRLLAIGHYIAAALNVLMALLVFVYTTFLTVMFQGFPNTSPQSGLSENFNPVIFFGLFGTLSAIAMLLGAVGEFLTARYLTQRVNHTFCIIVSALDCLGVPFGTLLGIATLIALERPSVKAMFAQNSKRSSL
jgi:hypothetical protein